LAGAAYETGLLNPWVPVKAAFAGAALKESKSSFFEKKEAKKLLLLGAGPVGRQRL
jgi:hypothetical protein